MTVPQLLQLYAPLAGMLALAFWVGVLSERVKGLRYDVKALQEDGAVSGSPAAVRLEEHVAGLRMEMDKIGRAIESIQRQLANLMQKGAGPIQEFHP